MQQLADLGQQGLDYEILRSGNALRSENGKLPLGYVL